LLALGVQTGSEGASRISARASIFRAVFPCGGRPLAAKINHASVAVARDDRARLANLSPVAAVDFVGVVPNALKFPLTIENELAFAVFVVIFGSFTASWWLA